MKLRIKFEKKGVLKYIGHLDLMRFFQKSFRRTDINVSYSGGFSPHMIMSFAQALGVGVESEGEYFDIEVSDDTDASKVMDKLNAQMTEGLLVTGVYVLPEKVQNAMASVAASSYEIHFTNDNPVTNDLIERFLSTEVLDYTKTTKSGDTTFNIKDFVFDIRLIPEGVFFCCDASSSGNLKPRFFLEGLLSLNGQDLSSYPYHVLRKELFLRKKDGSLSPLWDVNE